MEEGMISIPLSGTEHETDTPVQSQLLYIGDFALLLFNYL